MPNKQNRIIAHICLTDGTVTLREVEQDAVRRYLGGRGLGMYLLQNSADRNPLIFVTAPLTDCPAPGGRYCAVARSAETGRPVPLTSGTCWGAVLQKAGLSGIVIEGQAPDWTYLSVENGVVRLHAARTLLGMRTGETAQALQAIHGADSAVLCIGSAGEMGMPAASIACSGEHAFGKAGIGSLMGAKKLKAIAVRAAGGGDTPKNACLRCTAACRKARQRESRFSLLCDAYGLDRTAAARAMADGAKLPEAFAGLYEAYSAEPVQPKTRAKQYLPKEMTAVLDSLGCCLLSASAYTMAEYARLLTEAAGEHFSPEDLAEAGARILQLEETL